MPLSDGAPRYTRTAIALHWLVAVLVVTQIAWGWWMQDIPKQPVGPRVDAFNLHKSLGMTIFALMVLRLGWRLGHPAPALPAMRGWQRFLARNTHALIYVALFIQPLAGYLGSVWSGYPVKLYGMTLPAWGAKSEVLKVLMSQAHLVCSWVLVAAITLHVAGALKHAVFDRDGVRARMSPFPH